MQLHTVAFEDLAGVTDQFKLDWQTHVITTVRT